MHPYCLVCLRTAGFPILSHPCPWPPYTVHIPRLLFLIRSPSVVVSCLFITLHPRFSHLPDISLSYSLLLSKSTLFVPFFEVSSHCTRWTILGGGLYPHTASSWWPRCALFFVFSKINRQRMHVDEFPSHPLLLHSSTRRPPPAALHPPSSILLHVLPTNPLQRPCVQKKPISHRHMHGKQSKKVHCLLLSAVLRAQ